MGYDAFNRRDSAAFLELMDADVEALSRVAAIEGGCHDHDGVRRSWQNLLDAIPDFTLEVVEVRELGDVTLTKMHTSGHGADSDSPLEEILWVAVQWRDKKIVCWGALATEAEALEAVGLSEQSQDNVDLVQSLLQAFNRRDYAAAVEYLHPAVEVRPAVVGLDTAGPGSSRLLRGRGEVRGFFEELGATWVSQWVEFQEIIEAPGDRVLADELWRTEGRDGIRVDFEIVDVYVVRNRLIARVEGFLDRAEALEAVGLSE